MISQPDEEPLSGEDIEALRPAVAAGAHDGLSALAAFASRSERTAELTSKIVEVIEGRDHAMRETIGYANKYPHHKEGHFYTNWFTCAFPVHLTDANALIYKLRIVEVVADEVDDRHYWAWWDYAAAAFTFVYAAKCLLEMAFPYGTAPEVERGRGEVVCVLVEELGSFTHAAAKAQDWRP